ncbi:hypothetical protein CDIK_0393 [Cucumispora dikerogammari]|nr:hypothetical protein CDIK_0393 [Cucumispora dikerogammari]
MSYTQDKNVNNVNDDNISDSKDDNIGNNKGDNISDNKDDSKDISILSPPATRSPPSPALAGSVAATDKKLSAGINPINRIEPISPTLLSTSVDNKVDSVAMSIPANKLDGIDCPPTRPSPSADKAPPFNISANADILNEVDLSASVAATDNKPPAETLNQKLLLTPKLLYLTTGLLIYTLHTFRVTFITTYIGIPKSQYSTIYGIISFIGFFTNILIGYYNDKLLHSKHYLLLLILLSTITFQTLIYKNTKKIFWILYFFYNTFNNCILPLLDKYMLDLLIILNGSIKSYGSQRLFGTLAFPLSTFLIEFLINLDDNSNNNNSNYENIKYYQGGLALIVGFCIIFFVKVPNNNSNSNENNINNNNNNEKAGNIDNNINNNNEKAGNINNNNEKAGNINNNNEKAGNIDNNINNNNEKAGNIDNNKNNINNENNNNPLIKSSYIFFTFIILLNGITRSSMTLFLTIYWKETLKLLPKKTTISYNYINKILNIFTINPIGTCTTFGVLFEILILYFSHKITNFFGFYIPLLLAQLAQLLRFICYYNINVNTKYKLFFCCLFETLKGINFSLTHISAIYLVINLVPKNYKSTSTMIYNGTFTGLSAVIAGVFCGFLFNNNISSNNSKDFKMFFLTNIFICSFSIFLFCLKYGYDGVLF